MRERFASALSGRAPVPHERRREALHLADLVRAAGRALSGPVPVLGTVALRGGGFIAEAKRLPGVEVIPLSRENRDGLPGEIAARLSGQGPVRVR